MKKAVVVGGIALVTVLVLTFVVFNRQASAPESQTTSGSSTQESTDADTVQSNNITELTTEEVAKHSTQTDCWTIIEGSVYDLTSFVTRHPGGSDILKACGIDATTLFNGGDPEGRAGGHSDVATNQLAELKIGTVNQ